MDDYGSKRSASAIKVALKHKKIAIDGPAGAGKSTIAKVISKRLGYIYIDTGAMYRAVAYYLIDNGIDIKEEKVLSVLNDIEIDFKYDTDGNCKVYLCGNDVTTEIRRPDISSGASDVAKIVGVRLKLVELQRKMAEKYSVIMDGRDIGTYVLPSADIKIFLTADVFDRAMRRFIELEQKGMEITFEDVLADMKQRDFNDSNREFAPLKAAEDAIVVDTTGFSLDKSIGTIYNIIKSKSDNGDLK